MTKFFFLSAKPTSLVNPPSDLNIHREITQLQARFGAVTTRDLVVSFNPDLPLEKIHETISTFDPDIVHISIHGEDGYLNWADGHGRPVATDSMYWRTVFSKKRKLLYLNCCDSASLANDMLSNFEIVICYNSKIRNSHAISIADAFYRSLLLGENIEAAYELAREELRTLSAAEVDLKMIFNSETKPKHVIFFRKAELVARFEKRRGGSYRTFDGHVLVSFGVINLNRARHLLFFTTNEAFLDNESSYEDCLCHFLLLNERSSEGWIPVDDAWDIDGNFDIYAAIIDNEGKAQILQSTVTAALETYYSMQASENAGDVYTLINELKQR
jgi:hypothetical protein